MNLRYPMTWCIAHCWLGAAISLHRRAGRNIHYVPRDPLCPMDINPTPRNSNFKCLQLKTKVHNRIRTRDPRVRRPTLNRWAIEAKFKEEVLFGYLYLKLRIERVYRLHVAPGSLKPVFGLPRLHSRFAFYVGHSNISQNFAIDQKKIVLIPLI